MKIPPILKTTAALCISSGKMINNEELFPKKSYILRCAAATKWPLWPDVYTMCTQCACTFWNKISIKFVSKLSWRLIHKIIPQNNIDTCFSGRLFSKMARNSWIFHISHNGKLCIRQKWQKTPNTKTKWIVSKRVNFQNCTIFPIDLDKIIPKIPT